MATPAQTGALGLAAGVILGVLVGLQVPRSGGGAPEPVSAASAATPAAEAPAPEGEAPALEAPGPQGARAGASTREQREARPSTRTALAAAIAAIPRPEMPSGAGKITGAVRTAEKAPVAGAKVTLTFQSERRARNRPARSSSSDAKPPLEESVRRLIEQEVLRRASTRDAETDAAGAFVFDGLPEGKYAVSARAEGYNVVRTGEDSVEPGAVVDFEARPVGRVEATVILPDGRAPERATIMFRSGRNTEHEQWTPQDPVVEVDPGTYQVSARASDEGDSRGGPSLESATQRLEVGTGAPVRVLFEVRAKPMIRGKVVFPPGEARESGLAASVYALRFAGTPPDPSELPQSSSVKRSWVSGSSAAESRYQIDDIQPGTYLVGLARGNDDAIVASQVVEVADGPVTLDLAIPPMDRAKALHLTVLDALGAKVKSFEVQVTVAYSNGGRNSSGAEMVKLDDGTALLSLEGVDDPARGGMRRFGRAVPAGEDGDADVEAKVTLDVSSEEHGKKRVELEKGRRSGELVVRFETPATLDVSIPGYVGSALEGKASVTLVRTGASQQERQEAMWEGLRRGNGEDAGAVDAEGHATLGPAEAGRYEVVLFAQSGSGNGRWSRQEVSHSPIELRAGKNSLSLAVPALYSLVVEAAVGSQVMLAPEGKETVGNNSATIGKSGRATFELLPAGRYTLHGASADGSWGQMTVVVPASGPVKFAAEEHDAILIHVSSADGAIARMGFQDGDMIVAVEGTELTSDQQMQMAFMQMMAKESASVTVIRGGGRVELKIDGRKMMMAGADGGGEMTPVKRPK